MGRMNMEEAMGVHAIISFLLGDYKRADIRRFLTGICDLMMAADERIPFGDDFIASREVVLKALAKRMRQVFGEHI
jgi:hypothetical protein